MSMKKMIFLATAVVSVVFISFTAQAREVKPGVVVTSAAGSTLYLATGNDTLSAIPSMEVYNCLQLSRQDQYTVGQNKIDRLNKSPLLLASPAGAVYLIENGSKRHIASPAVFQRLGLDTAHVVHVSEAKINCLPDGAPLN